MAMTEGDDVAHAAQTPGRIAALQAAIKSQIAGRGLDAGLQKRPLKKEQSAGRQRAGGAPHQSLRRRPG